MNFAHLHLLLNHFPIIGFMVGLGLFAVSFFGQHRDLRRASLIVFVIIALLTIPAFMSGVGAQLRITGQPGVSDALILRHAGSAILALWFMIITGGLSLISLWKSALSTGSSKKLVYSIAIFALLTAILVARTGNTGGDIRHVELWTTPDGSVHEDVLGGLLAKFEPSPLDVARIVAFSKFCTAAIMDLHFAGLVLIIGTIGVYDLRVMGFLKQLPLAPLHKTIPWGLAGLGLNVVTGMLAYMGMPDLYNYDAGLWLKILALLLLGANAVIFYMGGIFDKVEPLGAGEDAPLSAKLVAGSSLFLWLTVITLGRLIQVLGGSIPEPPK